MTSSHLNEEQQQAVTHGDGPLLIIAGAGTGKTTVITERIKHLVLEKNISTEHILALTFTEKAAKEMEERVDVALPYGYTQMWISTFHAFCDRVLRDEAIHIGLNPAYKLITETEGIIFLRKHLFDLDLQYFRPLGNPNKFLQGLLQHFARLKDEDIIPQQYIAYAEKLPKKTDEEKEEYEKIIELAKAYAVYEKLKIEEGIMDFSDLIAYTIQLFRSRKHILKMYQDKFHYILIDEFQDTNYAQNQLALLLTGAKQNITVVGDDDQAIYRWRGAAISNMIQFRQHFPKTKIVTLIKNYRSTEKILNASYQLIQNNNPDRLEIKENINKQLIATREKKGEDIRLILTNRAEEEIENIIFSIQESIKKHAYTYKDFAILVRANDQAQPFMNVFEKNKIPYQFLGPGQLFHQEEIKDLIAYLKVLYNPDDTTSLYRVLTFPLFHISGIEIIKLLSYAKKNNATLFETLHEMDSMNIDQEGKKKLQKITAILENHLTKVAKETAGQLLYAFLQDSGLLQFILETNHPDSQSKAQNIAKFFEKLKSFETQNEDASVFSVVDWLEISMQLGESPLTATSDWTENDAINILTVHASKGLEFPVVFIVNLVTQRFPSRERKDQIPLPQNIIKEVLPEGDYHMQEERRLFYVAMTRAKDMLYFTSANYYGDGKRQRKLSPFITEAIGENVLEKEKKLLIPTESKISLQPILSNTKSHAEKKSPTQPITYLSYSQIQTFDICPLHYKLRYLLNIPTPDSPSQIIGTSIHATLRDFYSQTRQNKHIAIDNIEDVLDKYWNKSGFDSKDHERHAYQHALAVLENYLHNNYSSTQLFLALETPFQFSINSALRIGGRIDRIDSLPGGKIEIIDYKTGNTLPDEKEIAKNLQLTMYCLAATEIKDPPFGVLPEQVILSLHYLEQGKIFSTTRTKEQLEKAKNDLLIKAEEIELSDFRCSRNLLCQNCEYKMLCKTF